MLSKQGWRLLENLTSLVGMLFKARYYPQGLFLSASLGSNLSFIWRSVLETQSIIRDGVCRRIRDGSQTSILRDPWLPCVSNPFVPSSHPALNGRTVQSLMLPNDIK